jgi:hypothetical protein
MGNVLCAGSPYLGRGGNVPITALRHRKEEMAAVVVLEMAGEAVDADKIYLYSACLRGLPPPRVLRAAAICR